MKTVRFSILLLGFTRINGEAFNRKEVERIVGILGEDVVSYTINGLSYRGLAADHYL